MSFCDMIEMSVCIREIVLMYKFVQDFDVFTVSCYANCQTLGPFSKFDFVNGSRHFILDSMERERATPAFSHSLVVYVFFFFSFAANIKLFNRDNTKQLNWHQIHNQLSGNEMVVFAHEVPLLQIDQNTNECQCNKQ